MLTYKLSWVMRNGYVEVDQKSAVAKSGNEVRLHVISKWQERSIPVKFFDTVNTIVDCETLEASPTDTEGFEAVNEVLSELDTRYNEIPRYHFIESLNNILESTRIEPYTTVHLIDGRLKLGGGSSIWSIEYKAEALESVTQNMVTENLISVGLAESGALRLTYTGGCRAHVFAMPVEYIQSNGVDCTNNYRLS